MNSFLSEYLSKYMRGVNSIEKYIKEKYAYQRIYDIYKSEFGESHPVTLIALNDLADFYRNMGEFNKALELHEKVYVKRRDVLGEKHPDTLLALADLADSYSDLEDYNNSFSLPNFHKL